MSKRQEQPPSSIEPDRSLPEQSPAIRNAAITLLKTEPEWVLKQSGMDQNVRRVLGDDFYYEYQAARQELDERFGI